MWLLCSKAFYCTKFYKEIINKPLFVVVLLEATQVSGSNKFCKKLVFTKFLSHKHVTLLNCSHLYFMYKIYAYGPFWSQIMHANMGNPFTLTAIGNPKRDWCWTESEEMGSPSDLPAADVLCDGRDVRTCRSLCGAQFPLLRGGSCSKL